MVQMVKNLPAMQETRVQSLSQEDPLEKGMATHSSILVWRIPWTEEPGGLWSMVSKSRTRLSDQQTDTRLNTRSYLQHAGSLVAAYAIWASLVAQLVKNPPAMRETWVQSLGWEDPLEKGKSTHSSILAWRIPWTV